MTELQILPLLDFSNAQISQSFFQNIKTVAEMMNTKLIIQEDNKNQADGFINKPIFAHEDENLTSRYQNVQEDDWRVFMPIFSSFDK